MVSDAKTVRSGVVEPAAAAATATAGANPKFRNRRRRFFNLQVVSKHPSPVAVIEMGLALPGLSSWPIYLALLLPQQRAGTKAVAFRSAMQLHFHLPIRTGIVSDIDKDVHHRLH